VAENKLVLNELSTYLSQPHISKIGFEISKQNSFCYNSFMGLVPLREAIVSFYTHTFLKRHDKDTEPAPPKRTTTTPIINPEHVVIGSGCAGLLNTLFCLLTDVHDAVLIPAPYYAAFDNDMKVQYFLLMMLLLLLLIIFTGDYKIVSSYIHHFTGYSTMYTHPCSHK